MKIKVSELQGAALDWAVGVAHKFEMSLYGVDPSLRARVPGLGVYAPWSPSKYWNQGGPIIDREEITWSMNMEPEHGAKTRYCAFSYRVGSSNSKSGPTKLIAAMRCYVASKLGEEVEVPEGLT